MSLIHVCLFQTETVNRTLHWENDWICSCWRIQSCVGNRSDRLCCGSLDYGSSALKLDAKKHWKSFSECFTSDFADVKHLQLLNLDSPEPCRVMARNHVSSMAPSPICCSTGLVQTGHLYIQLDCHEMSLEIIRSLVSDQIPAGLTRPQRPF